MTLQTSNHKKVADPVLAYHAAIYQTFDLLRHMGYSCLGNHSYKVLFVLLHP